LSPVIFADLGVASQPTSMGFSVQDARNGLEYNATNLGAMFCQKRNLFSPRFWRMVREILRFYRECPALLLRTDNGPTLGEYLRDVAAKARAIQIEKTRESHRTIAVDDIEAIAHAAARM